MDFDDEDFAEKYMASRFCNIAMDAECSYYQTIWTEECMHRLLQDIEPEKNELHHNPDIMYWIGYMYRYLSMRYGIASRRIYQELPFAKMLTMYEGLHTQSDEYAISVFAKHFPERRMNPDT